MTVTTAAAVGAPAGTGTPAVEPKPVKKPGPKRREFRSDWSPGAYRFTLDLNDRQEAQLTRAVGAARFAFNAALAEVKAQWGEPVTDPLNWSAYGLRAVWKDVRDTRAPWWGEASPR